ncbi:hypothetical protein EVC27_094 [Rhizobium phage RHph_I1_6]|uniref:Uncharacterized protein n=1 Tax=Rhizobium phage RHph_I1_6 TaxID=2509728 RepID=A0A7S5RFK2_9CAUD|nr:hypothetical protein PP745_gp097 [Rhizobium phage RHph_I1_6]QIG76616.1 hypothetical protein EVC27_094 [Rhizobium phage RHph_I1_6]
MDLLKRNACCFIYTRLSPRFHTDNMQTSLAKRRCQVNQSRGDSGESGLMWVSANHRLKRKIPHIARVSLEGADAERSNDMLSANIGLKDNLQEFMFRLDYFFQPLETASASFAAASARWRLPRSCSC